MNDTPTATPASRRRWPRRLLITALLLVILPIGVVLIALHSSTATRLVLHSVADRVDGLAYGSVEGTLSRGLALRELRYANASITVEIERLTLSATPVALLRGELLINEVLAAGIRATPNAAAPDKPATPLSVPELAAPLPIVVQSLTVTDVVWTPLPQTPLQRLDTQIDWSGTTVTIPRLSLVTPDVQANGTISLNTAEDVAVQATVDWVYPDQALNGRFVAQGSLAELNLSHALSGQYSVTSSGTIALLNRVEPLLNMQHTCPDPCRIGEIQISAGLLTHSGTPSASDIRVAARISGAALDPVNLRGELRYADSVLNIQSLTANGDALEALFTGRVSPGATPLFEIDGTLSRLDARVLNAGVSGSLSAEVHLSGNSAQSVEAALKNLAGTINGYALTGSGTVQRSADQLRIDRAALALGDNTVTVGGTVANNALNLDASIALPKLEQIDPRLSGSVLASARVRGNTQQPQIETTGEAATLAFDEFAIGTANFSLNVDRNGGVNGQLQTQDIRQAQREFGSLKVKLDGSLEALGLAATFQNSELDVQLESTIARSKDATVVNVKRGSVNAQTFGVWTLSEPFSVRQSAGSLTVDPFLWQSDTAFARITNLQRTDNDLALRAELANLPLALAAGFLPPEVSVVGQINAEADVELRNNLWRGDVRWEQTDTVMKLRTQEGSRRLALPVVSLQVANAGNGAAASLAITGDFGLEVGASINASNPELLFASPISGTLNANMTDLSWLTPWLGEVSKLAGVLRSELDIGGTVNAPAITGAVTLEDGTLAYDAAGLQLEAMTLVARAADAGRIELEGAATSGGGSLRFAGTIGDPMTAQRRLELSIDGEDVQAFNAAEYQVWLSPELKLNAAQSGASISGRLTVPRANIRVRELPPDVVQRSKDIVVDGREVEAPFSVPFDGDVQVALGDEVHVFALGLDADIGGDLRVRFGADQAPRLDGRLFLEQGRYAAYGQKLDIERGNLFYAGPIDNPTLDVRAARKIEDTETSITAGVMVSGPATSPEISIFTDPPTSETDALSYLLLGRAAGDTSGTEGDALSKAALSIGMSQSSPLTTRIASGLGLDELTVGGDNVEAAELVAGKQLNDRLYIRYSYGVFSNLGAILLRYRLSRRLALEAGSSDVQSIDVLYTIEK